jgi:hypothetical protein
MKLYKDELYPCFWKIEPGDSFHADAEVPDEIGKPYIKALEKFEKELRKLKEYIATK